MSYSQFKTISSAKIAFNLTVVEGDRFLPAIEAIAPSAILWWLFARKLANSRNIGK